MQIDIEKELEQAIQTMGGRRVSEIVGHAPDHENADFVFERASVIAELKCLETDQIHEERSIGKASALYLEELNNQRAPVLAYGTVKLTTEGFSRKYWEKIGEIYRVPIERVIRKADRQIYDTKKALSMDEAKGLLILANNNHSALTPWHAKYLLEEILDQPLYEHINNAVYITGNQKATIPGVDEEVDCWFEIRRRGGPIVTQDFLKTLRLAWYRRIAKIRGVDEPSQTAINTEFLAKLDNKPNA